MINFIESIYRTMPDHSACIKFAKITSTIVKMLFMYYAMIIALLEIMIFVRPIVMRKMSLAVPMIIIGTDPNTILGFVICTLYQMPLAAIACVIMYQVESLIVVVFINIPMISSIITQELDRFETKLRDGLIAKPKVTSVLINYILIQLKYNEYVNSHHSRPLSIQRSFCVFEYDKLIRTDKRRM